MLIFWQECKHILRSKFLWVVMMLCALLGVFFAVTRIIDDDRENYEVAHIYTQKYGPAFTKDDVETYRDIYLHETQAGKNFQEALKEAGLPFPTEEEMIDSEGERKTEFSKKLDAFREKDFQNYITILQSIRSYLGISDFAATRSTNPYSGLSMETWLMEKLSYRSVPLPDWKTAMLKDAVKAEEERIQEILREKEKQYLLPLDNATDDNKYWFTFPLDLMGQGLVWAAAFVLAGIAAGRSLGGSFQGNMQGVVYLGKPGRRFGLYKVLAVLAVSAAMYLFLSFFVLLVYVLLCRTDVYWNVPLSTVSDGGGMMVSRFFITIGGYWLFQLGVGLAAVLIMALIFCAAMLVTKNFYAGSAISVGVSLLLLGIIQMVPAAQNSFLVMGSPIGLYLNVSKFLQQDFLFSILPHFEGIMLLIWCGIAAVLGVVGFMRFRKAAL